MSIISFTFRVVFFGNRMRALASIFVMSGYVVGFVHMANSGAATFSTELRPFPFAQGSSVAGNSLGVMRGDRIRLRHVERKRICGDPLRSKTLKSVLLGLLPCGHEPAEHFLRIEICPGAVHMAGLPDLGPAVSPTISASAISGPDDCQLAFPAGAASQDLSKFELDCLIQALPPNAGVGENSPIVALRIDVTAKTVEVERSPAAPPEKPEPVFFFVLQGRTAELCQDQMRELYSALKSAAEKLGE